MLFLVETKPALRGEGTDVLYVIRDVNGRVEGWGRCVCEAVVKRQLLVYGGEERGAEWGAELGTEAGGPGWICSCRRLRSPECGSSESIYILLSYCRATP